MASAPHRGLEIRATTRSDRAFGRARGRARGVASERGGVSRWVALGFATHISAATSYAFSPGSETSPPSDEPAFAPGRIRSSAPTSRGRRSGATEERRRALWVTAMLRERRSRSVRPTSSCPVRARSTGSRARRKPSCLSSRCNASTRENSRPLLYISDWSSLNRLPCSTERTLNDRLSITSATSHG